MRTMLLTAAGVLAAVTLPGAALAQSTSTTATVAERDARGRATKVEVAGRVYEVCRAGVTDACINPREAGLNFGNVPLDHWPGAPASEQKASATAAATALTARQG